MINIPNDLTDLAVSASSTLGRQEVKLNTLQRRKDLTAFERRIIDRYRIQVVDRNIPLTFLQRRFLVHLETR